MSKQLPACQEEMMKIPHVTKANYQKYGAKLLEITQNYSTQIFGRHFRYRSVYLG